jgi:serine/threonine-protein kinase
MSDPRVLELLEEILESGRTPEEACADAPGLLGEVRQRLKRCLNVDAEVDDIFPPPGATPGATPAGSSASGRPLHPRRPDDLPLIPGYEVESVLGRGGMGVVYKAVQLKLRRPVAVKMILAGAYARSSELTRFTREAEAVASLRHAHVVQVYDVGELDGLPFFTMEYVDGGSLGQKLAGTPQPARQAADLMAKLADAVQAAHAAGIVHRDLKPANILLTSDGTPKVTDFGLARHFGEDQTLTLSGARVGTPSYMAPEQASGKANTAGPPSDVYSLGAILYELLTGRPPFRAETAAATVQQVIYQDPAPPSRLNSKVPRDLETICLKCLNKDVDRRYAGAAALADDLRRFLAGRPILARPPGWGGRLARWCRREPAAAGLVATVVVVVALGVGGGFWLERQRADARAATARQEERAWQAVKAALRQAAALQEQGRWPEVRAVLQSAPTLLDASAPAELAAQLRQARADAEMVTELEDIRLRTSEGRTSRKSSVEVDQSYGAAFREYGIPALTLEPEETAARVRKSGIRQTLLVFLHDWISWAPSSDQRTLRAVIELLDDDDWRRAVRKAYADRDVPGLKALARAPEARTQPPVVLAGLANALNEGAPAEEVGTMLREAQQRYPADFWSNYQLADFLRRDHPQEAAGYFRAAVAVRPTNDRAYAMLARTLRDAGDAGGAIDAFRKATALNPNQPVSRDLARILASRGRLEEARIAWGDILKRDPSDHEPWYGYAQLCLFLGKEQEYRRARGEILDRFAAPDEWVVAERTSLASLLLPAAGDELRRTVALADRAVEIGPKPTDPHYAFVQFVKGLSEYRQGHWKQALPWLREAASKLPNRAGPRIVLAMAQHQSGATAEARRNLAAAVAAYNWKVSQADHPTVWVSHALRREAEAMMLPNLPAFLRGEYQPRDNDERLAMLGACQYEGRYAAAARLYADAFAADPRLADQLSTDCATRAALETQPNDRIEALQSECRFLATRCAALAGCGLGNDSAKLDDGERAHLREQARAWMRADLAAWGKTVDGASPSDRNLAKEMLTLWQTTPDLAQLRNADSLQSFPAEEREEWAKLFNEVRLAVLRTP